MFQRLEANPRFVALREKLNWVAVPLFCSCLALDVCNVNATLANIKDIEARYNISNSQASWALSAYAICFSGFIVVFGRIGDIIGHHLLFVFGMFSFGIFSLLVAAIPNFAALLLFRSLQGMAAASTVPSSYALIATTLKGRKRVVGMALASLSQSASHSVALIIGGAFGLTTLGYKGFFWVSFALAMLLTVLAVFVIKPAQYSNDKLSSLDFPGCAIYVASVVLIIFGITNGGESWKATKTYVPIIVGGVLLIFFFVWETWLMKSIKYTKDMHHLFPPEMWSFPNVVPQMISAALCYMGLFGSIYVSLEFFENVYHESALIAGLRIAPIGVMLCIPSVIWSRYFGRVSPRLANTLGYLVELAGAILLHFMNADKYSYYQFGLSGFIILPIGCCTVFVHYINLISSGSPLDMQGIVQGAGQTTAQTGVAFGFAICSSILGDQLADKPLDYVVTRYQNCFYVAIAGFIVGTIVVAIFVRDPENPSWSVDEKEYEMKDTDTIDPSGSIEV